MRLQRCELRRCGNSCTVQVVTLGQSDEHPQNAVKCSFIGLVKALVVVITVTKSTSEVNNHFMAIKSRAGPPLCQGTGRMLATGQAPLERLKLVC